MSGFPRHTCDPENACPVLLGAPCQGPGWREARPSTGPEAWEYAAAMRALSARGWAALSTAERQTINRWEGRP